MARSPLNAPAHPLLLLLHSIVPLGGSIAAFCFKPRLPLDCQFATYTLLRAYAGGLIELSIFPPRLVTSPGNFPVASALARVQAEQGSRVTNLRYHNLQIDDPYCLELLKLLDGTRDRSRLSQELSEHLDVATAPSLSTQSPVEKPDDQEAIDQSLESRLQALCRMALLSA